MKQFHVSCCYSLLFIITLQKFKNELKKNREKILGDAESSSKTKKKEVHIFYYRSQVFTYSSCFKCMFRMNVLTTAVRNSTMFQTIFMCSLDDNVFNPLSPNSDDDQFSLNDIHTLSRDLVMRIYKMNTYCFALIFYQIPSTHSLRKYIKIGLENLYVDVVVTYCIFTFF